MLVALYIGNHRRDTLAVRAGWALTRLVQKGEFSRVTHCEAVLEQWPDGTVDLGSSSLRDGGVRIKSGVRLDPASWWLVDVTQWDDGAAWRWFRAHDGAPYDRRGAVATVLPGRHQDGEFFCNEAVGAAVGLRAPNTFTPAQFAAICFTLGRNVTGRFFPTPGPDASSALPETDATKGPRHA